MHFTALSAADRERRLKASVSDLAEHHPELSAINVLTRAQRNGFIVLIVLVVAGMVLSPVATGIVVMSAATMFYAAGITNRIVLFWRSTDRDHLETVSDEDALAVPADQLPSYAILVPAYREPELIAAVLANLAKLDYPRDRLDVKILLESDDDATINAISGIDTGDPVEVVLIPVLEPRTKPKALNFGLSLCDAEIVTIYDVEDKPEPLQLRRAAVALSRLGPDVACVQAKLSYENVHQNLITKWFTLEYAMWFSLLLPGLVATGAALPLGGTSNHFRRSALEAVGAWDPYNVTEDADLGIRLYRHQYTVKVLDSVTLEEANSDFVNWVKQRSRWYKGYLQTFLIHLRQPRRFREDVGTKGVLQFIMFVGATPLLALINPVFWTMTLIWFVGHPHFIKAIFPAPVFYVSILCWSLGNFTITYLTLLTARSQRRYDLLWAALLVPVYWVMMSIAAIKAVVQLVSTPSFWEKTAHGLQGDGAPPDNAGKPLARPSFALTAPDPTPSPTTTKSHADVQPEALDLGTTAAPVPPPEAPLPTVGPALTPRPEPGAAPGWAATEPVPPDPQPVGEQEPVGEQDLIPPPPNPRTLPPGTSPPDPAPSNLLQGARAALLPADADLPTDVP